MTQKIQIKWIEMRCFIIQQNVNAHHFEKISIVLRSKEAWDVLEKYYDDGEKVKLHYLRRKYELMQMKKEQTITD